MQKLFKTQRLTAGLYTLTAVIVFLYTLCFMTEYKDLFGLKLKQNSQISFFHDSVLQMFNKQIFALAIFGILVILFSFLLEIFSKVPDKFALLVIGLSLRVCCAGSVYAISNIQAVESFYRSLDFQYLRLEGMADYEHRFGTLRIGTGIYVLNVICCVIYGVTIVRSYFKFLKMEKKGSVEHGQSVT